MSKVFVVYLEDHDFSSKDTALIFTLDEDLAIKKLHELEECLAHFKLLHKEELTDDLLPESRFFLK